MIQEEKRKHKRHKIQFPACTWVPLPVRGRFLIGKTRNVSRSGAFIIIKFNPMFPDALRILTEGKEIEVNIPRTNALAKEKGQYARIRKAIVVRVDLMSGHGRMGLGIKFAAKSQQSQDNQKGGQ